MGKYNFEIDPSVRNGHTLTASYIGYDKTVLEVGCATGYMTKFLKENYNCVIDCIDIDADAAISAAPYSRKTIVADIENFDFSSLDTKYDVILFADVLEHLRFPENILVKSKYCLKNEGIIVASIPNITHASICNEIANGRFEYRHLGLLDNTHIKFFSRSSLLRMFIDCGFTIEKLDFILVLPEETEFASKIDHMFLKYVQSVNEDWNTYQFVLVAKTNIDSDQQNPCLYSKRLDENNVSVYNEKINKLLDLNSNLKRQLDSLNKILKHRARALSEITDEMAMLQRESLYIDKENLYLRNKLLSTENELNWLKNRTTMKIRLKGAFLVKKLLKNILRYK